MEALKKYPPALEAVGRISEDYKHGDFIPDDVILDLLEVDTSIDRNLSADQIREAIKQSQLYQMSATEMLKSSLLKDHSYMLVRDTKRKGWNIAKPEDQTNIAMQDLAASNRKNTRKALTRMAYVDRDQLTIEQQRENSEAIAKVALLRKTQNQTIGFTHKLAISEAG